MEVTHSTFNLLPFTNHGKEDVERIQKYFDSSEGILEDWKFVIDGNQSDEVLRLSPAMLNDEYMSVASNMYEYPFLGALVLASNKSTGEAHLIKSHIYVKPNTTYTFSASIGAAIDSLNLKFTDNDGSEYSHVWTDLDKVPVDAESESEIFHHINKIAYTFKTSETAYELELDLFIQSEEPATLYVYVFLPKLEEGKDATEWKDFPTHDIISKLNPTERCLRKYDANISTDLDEYTRQLDVDDEAEFIITGFFCYINALFPYVETYADDTKFTDNQHLCHLVGSFRYGEGLRIDSGTYDCLGARVHGYWVDKITEPFVIPCMLVHSDGTAQSSYCILNNKQLIPDPENTKDLEIIIPHKYVYFDIIPVGASGDDWVSIDSSFQVVPITKFGHTMVNPNYQPESNN